MENVETQDIALPTEAPKRKRGRPAKKESETIIAKPKKKRGRPVGWRKQKTITTEIEPAKMAKLSKDDFWKYQALSIESAFYELALKEIGMTLKNLEFQTEALKQRMLHLKGPATDEARKKVDEARSAFQIFKDEIESKLGFSLNGTEINHETFEVKKVTSDPKK